MTIKYDFSFSRHVCARVLQIAFAQKEEGAGKTGCALHPRSRVQGLHIENAHEHTGSAEAIRPSLRNGFTAYLVLSPVTGFLATVALQKNSARLDASVGASGPHDFAVRNDCRSSRAESARDNAASTASRPNVSDDGQRPSLGTRPV
jgi:hypothetical protein